MNNSNFDIIDDKKEENNEHESDAFYKKEINKEIYPGEFIKINKDESLLFKKLNLSSLIEDNSDINNSFENKNTKLQYLLNSFEKENKNKISEDKDINDKIESNINIGKDKSRISDNVSNNFYSNKNLINFKNVNNNEESNKNIISLINNQIEERNKVNWDKNSFIIHNNISFQLYSSYENLNLISGQKLIKNKLLQKKLKNYLLEEIQNFSSCQNIGLIKKTNSFAFQSHYNKLKINRIGSLKPRQRRSSSFDKKKSNLIHKLTKKKIRKALSTLNLTKKDDISPSKKILRSSSFNKFSIEKTKKSKKKFSTGVFNQLGLNKIHKKKISNQNVALSSKHNMSNIIHNNNYNLDHKKTKLKKSSVILATDIKSKRKKDDILSKINFNIQNTNQNLNNPDEFYSNYFNTILEGEIAIKNKKKSHKNISLKSMADITKVKKERDKLGKFKGSLIK